MNIFTKTLTAVAAVAAIVATAPGAEAGLVDTYNTQQQQQATQQQLQDALCDTLWNDAKWFAIGPGVEVNRASGVPSRYAVNRGDLYRVTNGRGGCHFSYQGPMNRQFNATYGVKEFSVINGSLYEFFRPNDSTQVSRTGLGTVPQVVIPATMNECLRSNNYRGAENARAYCVQDINRALRLNF